MSDRKRSYSGTPADATPEELAAVAAAIDDEYDAWEETAAEPEGPLTGADATFPEFATADAPSNDDLRGAIVRATSDS